MKAMYLGVCVLAHARRVLRPGLQRGDPLRSGLGVRLHADLPSVVAGSRDCGQLGADMVTTAGKIGLGTGRVLRHGDLSGPRLKRLSVRGYRSIDSTLRIDFPDHEPLVLVGENNAGKSNVLRALGLLFGDFWPGNHRPEDHEFFGRSPEGSEIKVVAAVEGIPCDKGCRDSSLHTITWRYAPDDETPSEFSRAADKCRHSYMSTTLRQALFCMTVGVNRDLSYQLSYSSKWTMLSKLMRRFHERLVADQDRVEQLKVIFGSLVDTFQEVEEFQQFGDGLRSSFADFGANLGYGLDVDFSAYDPSNYFRSLRIFPHLKGTPRTYEEIGTGQEQVLAMAFAYAYAQAFGGEGLILAIEEPESHLHPLAQQWLAQKLRTLASTGVQVIVTTHSPHFVDLSKPWSTVFVRKQPDTGGTTATQYTADELAQRLVELGAPADQVDAETVGQFYEGGASYETVGALFCRLCVLVEGATEHLALPELLQRAGLDVLREGVAIVPVAGITNMAKWARLLRAYGIPVFAVFDSDTNKAPDKAKASRSAALEVLDALGVDGEPALIEGALAVGELHACFDPNFETAMRTRFGQEYIRLETEAVHTVGRAKQLKARFCARHLSADPQAEVWADLRNLAECIRGALPPQPPTHAATPSSLPRPGGVSRPAGRANPMR